ncbi:DMT family transporter [Francisella frigiditurris]|uniref:EamA-like transporter family protein n=1 Tax=Francisella frigiditurris TaxID=1542390 RepID=A0A1J0KRP6_9GAMM|nr:DMT family transporter [Francisella frigiditurris]APC96318.1 eamA-like transporter family protein [Francisella frigiditurris]
MDIKRKAVIALFIVTIFWGVTFPLIKISLEYISPGLFVTLRLSLSFLLLLPIVIKTSFKHKLYLLKVGFIFGSLEGVSFYFQTRGLYTVSSSESAFLTALSVVMIPFIASFFKIDRLTVYGAIASMISLIGIYALSGADFENFTIGYLWSVLCALAYAASVVYLSYETRRFDKSEVFKDMKLLIIFQVFFGIPLPFISDISSMYLDLNYILILAILFCSVSTIVCYYLQNTYQKYLSMSQVAVIFSFEPIFATIFGRIINHEAIYVSTILGGVLILSSYFIIDFGNKRRLKV